MENSISPSPRLPRCSLSLYHRSMSASFRHGAALSFALAASSVFGQSLQPPTNLIATSATSSSVQLSWTAAQPQAPGFIVERKTLNGTYAPAPNLPDGGMPGVAFVDNAIDPFTTYVYRVSATSLNGTSTPSNEITVGP